MNMKKIILLSSIVALLGACGSSGNGELIGTQNRQIWNPTDPYGMVFIPQGSFNMGPSDQDVPFANVTASKTISVGAFYMDETEITNNEYRQFTNWVRDSILRTYLMEYDEEKYAIVPDYDLNPNGIPRINWDVKIRMDDQEVRDVLEEEMYLPENERLDGRKEFDTRKYVYKYQVLDVQAASSKSKREGDATGKRDRSEFLSEVEVSIFPDTLTWIHDYAYSFNDPFTKNYFFHPAFDDYPVVGINWKQATAFTKWRSKMMNAFLRKIKKPVLPEFRLPTESEWEYASRGGLDFSPYPWGGPYTRNIKGCFLANFKPLRGNYVADGGLKTIKTASYNPNGYGLYDMAGNVAEWTSNAYDESALSYSHDMNMDYHYNANEDDNSVLKRKSIRGGSWKDIAYFIQTSTRTFEYQDTAKSYIGFRCAVDFLGRDKKDFE
jgi:gliding motility-associated lipoprotein GldK